MRFCTVCEWHSVNSASLLLAVFSIPNNSWTFSSSFILLDCGIFWSPCSHVCSQHMFSFWIFNACNHLLSPGVHLNFIPLSCNRLYYTMMTSKVHIQYSHRHHHILMWGQYSIFYFVWYLSHLKDGSKAREKYNSVSLFSCLIFRHVSLSWHKDVASEPIAPWGVTSMLWHSTTKIFGSSGYLVCGYDSHLFN